MAYTYLEFEKPISDLENKIESLRDNKDNDESVHEEISSLSDRIENLTKEIYKGLSIWQKVQVARHPHRPHFSDYIENIFTDFDELHGDRTFGDDRAIIGGLAKFKNTPVVLLGHEKGKSTEDKLNRNFGMAQPEGYRKAERLMKLAEDFNLPLMSCPKILETEISNIPPITKLNICKSDNEYWEAKIGKTGIRIGIAWQGSKGHEDDNKVQKLQRSFPIESLVNNLNLPDVRLISLQKEKL